MTNQQKTRAIAAQTVIKGLERRNMTGEFCLTAAEAREAALRFLKPGGTFSWGGSSTLNEIGFFEAAKGYDVTPLDRNGSTDPEETKETYRKILFCDTYYMSTNAITMDGMLVNIDGKCNRIAALAFGPEKVVIVAGMNKVAPDLDSAMKRARNVAAPTNSVRFNSATPCTLTGRCSDCQHEDSVCAQIMITRRSRTPDRIHVILVGEDLGY